MRLISGGRSSGLTKIILQERMLFFSPNLTQSEGVDIKDVNTVLFLRPTQSLTVFLQQLGRGLRHAENKECLTVLDYVGRAHEKYNYEQRFRALLHKSQKSVKDTIEEELLSLPRGCHVKMEKVAKEYILNNIRNAIINKSTLISRIRNFETETSRKLTLRSFLEYYNMSLQEFYGRSVNRSLYSLGCIALGKTMNTAYDMAMVKNFKNLFYLDSKEILKAGIQFFGKRSDTIDDEKVRAIYYYSFYKSIPADEGFEAMMDGLFALRSNKHLCIEIKGILGYKYDHLNFVGAKQDFNVTTPLEVHGMYTSVQVLAGMGYYNEVQKPQFREGVLHLKNDKTDIFFITLNKSDKDFSEATMYQDYPMNDTRFHWESQNKTSDISATALRYINHEATGNDILLFVREYKKMDGYASPFIFMGKAKYVSHSGSKPVGFVWELEERMPPRFLEENLNLAN